jgi:hypothetical protein
MKACCAGIEGRLKMRLRANPSLEDLDTTSGLKALADAFMRLQQDRHAVDYDSYEVIYLAQTATATWMTLRNTEMAQDYLLDMLGAK